MTEQAFTVEDLQKMWARTPERKVAVTQTKILEVCLRTNYKVAVSFSGGKDSAVLLDIVARCWAADSDRSGNTPLVVVFADTSNEFAGMRKFVKEYCKFIEAKHGIVVDLHIVKGEKTYFEVLKDSGYPVGSKRISKQVQTIRKWLALSGVQWDGIKDNLDSGIESAEFLRLFGAPPSVVLYLTGIKQNNEPSRNYKLSKCWRPLIIAPFEVSPDCCEILKKAPMKIIQKELGLSPIIGEMAADGEQRRKSYLQTGCNAFKNGKAVSKPMGFWLEKDVLWYHERFQLPHFHSYGDLVRDEETGELHFTGEQRTGCKLCLFGCQFKDRKAQFERLYETEPQMVDYAFRSREEKGLGYREVLEYINKNCKCDITIPEQAVKE